MLPESPAIPPDGALTGAGGEDEKKACQWLSVCGTKHTIMILGCQVATSVGNVVFEDFRDYSSSRFAVTISRVQQLALQKACAPVPLPSKQLEIANAKKDKESKKYHGQYFINVLYILYVSFGVLPSFALRVTSTWHFQ